MVLLELWSYVIYSWQQYVPKIRDINIPTLFTGRFLYFDKYCSVNATAVFTLQEFKSVLGKFTGESSPIGNA